MKNKSTIKKLLLLLIIPFLSFGQSLQLGCTDETACNYNSEATEDDGNCTYPEVPFVNTSPITGEINFSYPLYGYDCDGNCLLPQNMCFCQEIEYQQYFLIEGCWWTGDPENEWYEPPFWIYPSTESYEFDPINCAITSWPHCGCLDENDDGWCDDINLLGCTDWAACNFNPDAIQDDGSCEDDCINCEDDDDWITEIVGQVPSFSWVSSCADAYSAGFLCSTYLFTGSVTFGEVCGCWCYDCNDPLACNFNPDALNGSTVYCDYESCLCDTVFVQVLDTIIQIETDTVEIIITDTIVETEYVEVIITEYIDCDTGLPCTSGMAEIIEKSKTDGKLYNLLGQEIFRREGIYIEGGEIKYRFQ